MKRIEQLIRDGNFNTTYDDDGGYIEIGVILKRLLGNKKQIIQYLLEEIPEPQKLTSLEYELAKFVLKEGSKWLARDANGILYVYDTEPVKSTYQWGITLGTRGEPAEPLYCALYQFVKWEDEEPTNLQELIDNCEVED